MTIGSRRVRHITAVLSLLALASSGARAQSARDSAARAQGSPDSTRHVPANTASRTTITLSPAHPRQGSVVRITVHPVAAPHDVPQAIVPPQVPADSVTRDSLPTATIVLRPQADSLRSRPDSVRPGLDSLRAILDTLSLRRDTTRIDSVRADSAPAGALVEVRGTLFGEPLHFRRQSTGEYVAIGGIPVDAPASTRVAIVVSHAAGETDTTVAVVPIGRTAYKMEKLTVAPKFGQAPDPVLAARIAREQELAAAVSRRAHETPRLWEGEFRQPRTSRVTSAFGDGREFNGTVQSRHMGLDLAGAVGAPVVATNRGVVALVGSFYLAGNAVYIDHGGGLVTAYFHLSKISVAQGDTVAPGARIGLVGATGRVTGPHLHWVARYGAVTVDPSTLLQLDAADTTEPVRNGTATVPPPAPPVPSAHDDHPSAG